MKLKLTLLLLISNYYFSLFAQNDSNNKIYFEENKGQLMNQDRNQRNDVLFFGSSGDLNFYISEKGIHYQLIKETLPNIAAASTDTILGDFLVQEEERMREGKTEIYRVDILFRKNSKNKIQLKKQGEQSYFKNYYNTPKNTEPILHVKSYESMLLENVFDNIDLKFYQNNDGLLEYDFIVKPGANHKDIQLKIEGADLALNKDGVLILKTPFGEIGEGPLVAYQEGNKIESAWTIENDIVSYDISDYDHEKTLIIDPPVRIWATYFGGTNFDEGTAVAVDNSNNVYLGGDTRSLNIATTGAHLTTFPGPSFMRSIYLAKLDENQNLLWCTYYGSTGNDIVHGCEVDSDNNVVITGRTTSENNISTPGAFQETYAGGTFDAYIVKFDSLGTRQWATYFGGPGYDIPFGLAIDDNENIIIAGGTSSNTQITTPGSHQVNYGGASSDGFVAKFSPTGNRLWSSYYGGIGTDEVVKCYSANSDIYLSGSTGSGNMIATPGTHQTNNAGNFDAFFVKMNANGQRQWGTYFGGTQTDAGRGVKFHNGHLYAVGTTSSSNQIAFNSSYLSSNPGGLRSGYIAKFNDFGSLDWATYFGGEEEDLFWAVDVDSYDNIVAVGHTSSLTGIANQDAFQNIWSGDLDGLLVSFTSDGQLNWSSYYGGVERDESFDVTFDLKGDFYMVGSSRSATNISAAGALYPNLAGVSSGFLAKFDGFAAKINAPDAICFGDSVEVEAGPSYADSVLWSNGSNLFTQGFIANQDTTITLIAYLDDRIDTISKTIQVLILPNVIANAVDSSLCEGETISLFSSGGEFYQWSGPLGFNTSNAQPQITNASINNSGFYYLVAVDSNACTSSDSIFIEVNESPSAQLTPNTTLCEGETLLIEVSGVGNANVQWQGPNNFSSIDTIINFSPVELNDSGSYSLTLTATNNCTFNDEVVVVVNEKPQILFTVLDEDGTCNGQIELQITNGAAPFDFIWSSGLANTDSVDSLCTGNYSVEVSDFNACKSTQQIFVGTTVSTASKMSVSSVQIFPNPSNALFNLTFTETPTNISLVVYDMLGKQVVIKENINSNSYIVDLQEFENGIYWLEIYTSTERLHAKKLIKF